MKDLISALRKKAQESKPVDLFDLLTPADKDANRLIVEIALMIKSRRKDLGYSQDDLADILGISQPMVSQYESGNGNFTVETIAEICAALGMKMNVSFEDLNGVPLTQYTDKSGSIFDYKKISEAA